MLSFHLIFINYIQANKFLYYFFLKKIWGLQIILILINIFCSSIILHSIIYLICNAELQTQQNQGCCNGYNSHYQNHHLLCSMIYLIMVETKSENLLGVIFELIMRLSTIKVIYLFFFILLDFHFIINKQYFNFITQSFHS